MSLSDLLVLESEWSEQHAGESGEGKDWESGFVAGLRQAIYLISRVEECSDDD